MVTVLRLTETYTGRHARPAKLRRYEKLKVGSQMEGVIYLDTKTAGKHGKAVALSSKACRYDRLPGKQDKGVLGNPWKEKAHGWTLRYPVSW